MTVESLGDNRVDEGRNWRGRKGIVGDWRTLSDLRDDFPSLCRYASHLSIILLTVLVIIVGRGEILSRSSASVGETQSTEHHVHSVLGNYKAISRDARGYLTRAVVPNTRIARRNPTPTVQESKGGRGGSNQASRTEIITYTVQMGDTVYDIAQRFGISGETILWANGKLEDNPDLLAVGQKLTILPVSGVLHVVREEDTLASVAALYKVDMASIVQFPGNNLSEPYDLTVGQKLIVPGGRKPHIPRQVFAYKGPVPTDAKKGTRTFGWPASGYITQKFWAKHRAIDIGAPKGTPIYAADSGYVTYAGWSDVGYGRMIIIDHGNGFQTLYAHLSVYYVEEGQSVAKGEKIGLMGETGNATGPHLHFEIIRNGVRRNPLIYLP